MKKFYDETIQIIITNCVSLKPINIAEIMKNDCNTYNLWINLNGYLMIKFHFCILQICVWLYTKIVNIAHCISPQKSVKCYSGATCNIYYINLHWLGSMNMNLKYVLPLISNYTSRSLHIIGISEEYNVNASGISNVIW